MPQSPPSAYVSKNSDGAFAALNLNPEGALIFGDEAGVSPLAGNVFLGANTPGAALSAALATTYTGICLSNPAASGKNLVLLAVAASLLVAPTVITSLGLIGGYAAGGVTVHTTALTPHNAFLNEAAPVGKLDAACTIVGTPAWFDWIGQAPTATTSLSCARSYNGAIIIPPGGYVAIGGNIASPAAGFVGAVRWAEVDAAA